jgi:hypothetical protein
VLCGGGGADRGEVHCAARAGADYANVAFYDHLIRQIQHVADHFGASNPHSGSYPTDARISLSESKIMHTDIFMLA